MADILQFRFYIYNWLGNGKGVTAGKLPALVAPAGHRGGGGGGGGGGRWEVAVERGDSGGRWVWAWVE